MRIAILPFWQVINEAIYKLIFCDNGGKLIDLIALGEIVKDSLMSQRSRSPQGILLAMYCRSPTWTTQNRRRYDRSELRYPSDLTDADGRMSLHLISPARPGSNKRTVDIREVMNGVMYVYAGRYGCATGECVVIFS